MCHTYLYRATLNTEKMTSRRPSPLHSACGALLVAAMLLVGAYSRPAMAQSAEEPDEGTKMTNYSLYYEDFKAGNYASARNYVQWMLENAPAYAGPGKSDDRNFERAVVIYDSLASRATDPDLARAYLDTALALHDQAVSTLKDMGVEVNEFKWTLDKGRFIQKHPQQLADIQNQAIEQYRAAYELNPEGIDSYYLTLLVRAYAQEDKQKAIDFMEELEERYPDNAELAGYIAQVRNMLFDSPQERVEFLENQFEKNPADTKIASELFDIYQELGMRQEAYAMGEKLMEMEPNEATYRIMAKLRLDDGQPQEAFELYEKAVELAGTATKNDYYNMGVAQQQMGSLARARTFFRQALEQDPNFGAAMIAIGDLYVTAVSNCGSFEREDQAVYWLAVDYYNRAKSIDPSVSSAANNKIRTYSRSFPNQEALFFKNWQPGQSYRIDYGCYSWINETTTVKAP